MRDGRQKHGAHKTGQFTVTVRANAHTDATDWNLTSVVLSAELNGGSAPVLSGESTDILRGTLNGDPVVVKVLRIYPPEEAKVILQKRAPVWKKLSHPNIVPFHGVDSEHFQLSLVYDWGGNGNIIEYLASHPRVSRSTLLLNVAEGLAYLHGLNIPHGSLRGSNVIIGQDGRARLTEYGLGPVHLSPNSTLLATCGSLRSSRWSAPEIIVPSRRRNGGPVMESKAADVFAFGMLAVEVYTGRVPFEGEKDQVVVLRIPQGDRPKMPEDLQGVGLTVKMWRLFESCWRGSPWRRPATGEVVRRLHRFVAEEANTVGGPQLGAIKGEGDARHRANTHASGPKGTDEQIELQMMPTVVRGSMTSFSNPETDLNTIHHGQDPVVAQRDLPSEVASRQPELELVPRTGDLGQFSSTAVPSGWRRFCKLLGF